VGNNTTSTYHPADGDLLITQFDFILSPTTGTARGAFVDLNGDGCRRAGAGFDAAPPGADGPKTLACGSPGGASCTVTSDPCQGSPSGAFLGEMQAP
jgi:hypothetical protein